MDPCMLGRMERVPETKRNGISPTSKISKRPVSFSLHILQLSLNLLFLNLFPYATSARHIGAVDHHDHRSRDNREVSCSLSWGRCFQSHLHGLCSHQAGWLRQCHELHLLLTVDPQRNFHHRHHNTFAFQIFSIRCSLLSPQRAPGHFPAETGMKGYQLIGLW